MFKIISFLLTFCFITSIYSQDLLSGKDLSGIRIDQISDGDLQKYQQQLKASGISDTQAEQIAALKGLPPEEISKLRNRLSTISPTSQANATAGRSEAEVASSGQTTIAYQINPKIFGAELFTTSSLTFQPNIKIATPLNYELGPDDELNISVFGLQEASTTAAVNAEGIITIPFVGPIKVSGLTFEEASSRIRARMSTIYTSLRSGASRLAINLGKIRSIRVTIIGSNRPGTYTVSSLSTLFNVLYLAGGPAPNGSFRSIELLRNNKVDRVIDLYKFLTSGSQEDNINLKENDVIRIPIYERRVEITGQVKRAGIFELLPSETFTDLLRFTSGFTDSAYRASVKVIQLTDKERKIQDIPNTEFRSYKPSTGDYFEVGTILYRVQNRITINGAVFRPGAFELTERLTVSNLIRRADGLREDAYTSRGSIARLREDLTSEIIPFDIKEALAGRGDIELRREDVVTIYSIFDLRDATTVQIQGEVRRPGPYPFVEVLTLKDLILQAGGFTDAAYPQRIELARIIRRDTLTRTDVRLSQIIKINSLDDLSLASINIPLEPFDVITIRRMPGYLGLESVNADGQFQFPGAYVLEKRAERISDLIRRAGGFAPEAFPDGGYLRRLNEKDPASEIKETQVEKIQKGLKDSTGGIVGQIARPFDQIPLDIRKIISNPGSEGDLILKANDVLYIPRNDMEIRISGEVLFPTQATFNQSNNLKDYIGAAGGFTDNARKKKVYVLYPNGKAARTKKFLFFRSYPSIKPGTEIIVPREIVKSKRSTTADTAILASIVASIAGIVIALSRAL